MRAFPKGILEKPEVPWPDPPFRATSSRWAETVRQRLSASAGDGRYGLLDVSDDCETTGPMPSPLRRVDMSMLCVMSKKNVHKKAVVRKKIGSKLKTALGLVVRGADAEEVNGRMRLVFYKDAEKDCILPGEYNVRHASCSSHLMLYALFFPLSVYDRLDIYILSDPRSLSHAIPCTCQHSPAGSG